MGNDATEADFDAWAAWVAKHVDDACGVDASVDQFQFGKGPDSDRVRCPDDDVSDRVRNWLSNDAWEEFCSEGL